MNFIGQKNIKERLNNGIPNPILILGEKGIGKHTLVNYILEKSNYSSINEVSGEVSKDFLDNLYIDTHQELVLFDFSKTSEAKRIEQYQNTILKFVEEPPITKLVVILAESETHVLDTIKNRCQIFRFENYSARELREIGNNNLSDIIDEVIYKVVKTPLRMTSIKSVELLDMLKLADTMATKIREANVSNTLSISNKINFKDDDSKFSLGLFVDALVYKLAYYAMLNPIYSKALKLTNELKYNLTTLGVNKKYLFENYLLNLREVLL